MALKPLLVKIGADTTALERGLNKAGRSIAGLAKAAGAAGVLVAGALTAMTTQGLAAVDAQTKLARSLDGSANSLRAVQIAAGYAGVSVGEANTAMQQLNRELERAKEEGSPAADALKKLGLQASDLAGLDVDDRMAAIADRMNALGLSSGQASDILRDLGIRSRNMALLLIQGGDAIRSAREEVTAFGLELTKTQTDSIESANDAVARMGLVFEGLRNRLAVEVAPMLQTVADRFNALAQSDAVQTAIERLAGAFGDLAEIILSEDFIQTAIDGLTGLANISASVAEGMVAVSQNVEIVTIALSGLAIVVAGMGGPLTVVAGLLALALGGIAAWRRKAEDAATGSDTMKEALEGAGQAQRDLNAALDTFTNTAAPSAGREAIAAAKANVTLMESALAAAEAELEKKRAIQESGQALLEQNPLTAEGSGYGEAMAQNAAAAAAEVEAQASRLEAAQTRLRSVATRIMGADYTGGGGGGDIIELEDIVTPGRMPSGATRPVSREDARFDEYFGPADPEKPSAGLSTAEKLREQLEQRLEVLTNGLATEREVVNAWYKEGMDVLNTALEEEIINQEQYNEKKERLEEEHQKRLTDIAKAGLEERNASMQRYMGAAASLLKSFASMQDGESKKSFEKQKQLRKAAAIIEGIGAGIAAWRSGMEQGGLPLAITYAAVSAAQTAAQIAAINRQSYSGGSSGAASASAGAASGAASAPALPTQTVAINLQGDTFSRASVEGLLEQIQSQLDRGGRLVFQ